VANAGEIAFGMFGTFTTASQNFAPYAPDGWAALVGTSITSGHHGTANGEDTFMEVRTLGGLAAYDAKATCTSGYIYAAITTYRAKAANDGSYQLTSDLYF